MITIATYQYPHQAHLVQSKLESEGIGTFLKDKLTVQVNHFLSQAVGGVKLQINQSNFEQAKEILASLHFQEENENTNQLALDSSACPNCHSKNIGKNQEPRSKLTRYE